MGVSNWGEMFLKENGMMVFIPGLILELLDTPDPPPVIQLIID